MTEPMTSNVCARHRVLHCPACFGPRRDLHPLPSDVTPLTIAEPEAMGAGEGAHGHTADPKTCTCKPPFTCDICAPAYVPEGEDGLVSPLPPESDDARARETAPYWVTSDPPGVAMRLVGGNHRICIVNEHGMHSPQLVADALNMLHRVRAGTAGAGAPAALGDELARFFREEATAMGQEGDYELWTPAQTAIVNLRRFIAGIHLSEQRRIAMERAAAERDEAQAALQFIRDQHGDLLPRGAVLDALALLKRQWSDKGAVIALDEAAVRVSDLAGIGLPDMPEFRELVAWRQLEVGGWAMHADLPGERLRVIEWSWQGDARMTVTGEDHEGRVMTGDPSEWTPCDPPESVFAWSEDVPDGVVVAFRQDPGKAGEAMAGHIANLTGGRHDLFGVTSREQAMRIAERQRGDIHDLPAAHPVDVLVGHFAGSGREWDEAKLAELRAICDATGDGPFTAGPIFEAATFPIGAAVFAGDGIPYCVIEPDTVVGGSITGCVARAERIRDALNAVDEMTCDQCHDLGHSHAPDCPALSLAPAETQAAGIGGMSDLRKMNVPVNGSGNWTANLGDLAACIITITLREVEQRQARRKV